MRDEPHADPDAGPYPRERWCAGLWNGYVETGATREARRERLAEVPAPLRAEVRGHLRTLAQIMRRSAERKALAARLLGGP